VRRSRTAATTFCALRSTRDDIVVVRVHLGAEALRVEIHKPGTRRETVWFEMGRA
jgi:hypothetical protein